MNLFKKFFIFSIHCFSVSAFLRFSCLLFIAGCSLISSRPFSPLRTDYPAGLDAAEIFRVLEGRSVTHERLWAGGEITLCGEPLKGKKFFNATLLYEVPDRMRLRGSRMLTSTLFEYVMNADCVAVLFNRTKEWFGGTLNELERHPEATLGLNPVEIPKALLIQQDFMGRLGGGEFDRHGVSGGDYLFLRTNGDNRVAFLLRRKDLLVREAAVYGKDGRLLLRLRYRRYGLFGGEVLPEDLEMFFASSGVTARVHVAEYKFPAHFEDVVFSPTPAVGFKRYPLNRLWESVGKRGSGEIGKRGDVGTEKQR
jgi:hypothetical protein